MSKIRVFTIQNESVYKKLLSKGHYQTDKRFICDKSFINAYKWLVDQAKLKKPSWNSDRPVWVWLKRPDLRQNRFFFDPRRGNSENMVLLELEIDTKDLLVSDFDTWHCVLNNAYYSTSVKDLDTFYEKHKKDGQITPLGQKILEKSWERCLHHNRDKIKQGIIEGISLESIRLVKFFKMLNKKK